MLKSYAVIIQTHFIEYKILIYSSILLLFSQEQIKALNFLQSFNYIKEGSEQ